VKEGKDGGREGARQEEERERDRPALDQAVDDSKAKLEAGQAEKGKIERSGRQDAVREGEGECELEVRNILRSSKRAGTIPPLPSSFFSFSS